MRLVSYLRVSTVGQAERGFGLDVQHEQINEWAERNGHVIVKECRDEGISGATDAVDRPGLNCALGALPDEADGIVMARLDRLARGVTFQEAILAAIWRDGGRAFALDHGGEVLRDDPDDPMRTAMREMAGVFAGLDRRMIVKRLRDGRRAVADRGGKAHGRYPFGMSKAGPVEREQQVLTAMRQMREDGLPWHRVATQLNDRGPDYAPRHADAWSLALVNHTGRKANIA